MNGDDNMQLYLATLEITREIMDIEMETKIIGIFNDIDLAIENANKELENHTITDTQIQELKNVWDKYKKHIQGYLHMISEENEEAFYAELDNLGIREVYEDPQELLGANIYINIASYNINEPYSEIIEYTKTIKNGIYW
jgi:type III secretory pathway component EscR